MTSYSGRTLYVGNSNNTLTTILTEEVHGALLHKPSMSILDYPKGIAVFVPNEAWEGRLAEYATGTYDEYHRWTQNFRKLGGEVLPASVSNLVPFSNQVFDGEESLVLTPEEVCKMFGITLMQLRRVTMPSASRALTP